MGIINAVAIELEPEQHFDRLHLDLKIDADWLATLADGNWNIVGRAFGRTDTPVFYELTIDPSNWDGPSALHIAYFTANAANRATTAQPLDDGCCLASADAICRLGADSCQTEGAKGNECTVTGPSSTAVDLCVLLPSATEKSVFERYRRQSSFADPPCIRSGNWKALHRGAITGGHPGALWNASFAIKRADLPHAIPAICAAVADLPQSFVFTVRFVKGHPEHGIEFTRFADTAVIEIDGLSPWICQKVTQRWLDAMGGSAAGIEDRLDLLSRIERTLPVGADRMATALRVKRIEFSNHWGKLGHIAPASVHAAFGDPAVAHSRLRHWRQTRDELLTSPLAQAIFWNWGAVHMGLIDRPSQMP
jgi:hypothetical protein